MLAVFTLCFAATAGAQATVKGTVVDADSNEPLIGATVTVGGTSLGTVTDYEGNFTLKVTSAKATIEIKYLGYLDKSIKLTQQGEVNWGSSQNEFGYPYIGGCGSNLIYCCSS